MCEDSVPVSGSFVPSSADSELRSVQNWLKYVLTLTTRVTWLATFVRLSPIGQKYLKAHKY